MDELVKRLRELQTITEHCDEQSCDECENRELCDKHDNKTLSGTYKEAADAIEELSKPRWISVTDRLPEDGQYVLAYSADDDFTTVEARHKFEAFQITHWMPLPEPPKEDV